MQGNHFSVDGCFITISDNLEVKISNCYVCGLCEKMFTSKDNITDHMKRYHESQDHLDQLHQ